MFVRALIGLTNLIFGVVEFLLGLRFVLRLFGANSSAGFVDWVYDNTEALIAPFRGAFPSAAVQGGFVIEITTLFAMLIYGILAYLIIEFLQWMAFSVLHYRRYDRPVEKVEHTEIHEHHTH